MSDIHSDIYPLYAIIALIAGWKASKYIELFYYRFGPLRTLTMIAVILLIGISWVLWE